VRPLQPCVTAFIMDRQLASDTLKALQNPQIAPFIDWERFLLSRQFAELAWLAIAHFRRHGDSGDIRKLANLFYSSPQYTPLLHWFCDHAGLQFGFDGQTLVLKKAQAPVAPQGRLEDYVARMRGDAAAAGARIARVLPRNLRAPARGAADERRPRGSPTVRGGAPGLGKRR
jgi:hypothetical protein